MTELQMEAGSFDCTALCLRRQLIEPWTFKAALFLFLHLNSFSLEASDIKT